MAYTAAQQARLDAAQKKIDDTQKILDIQISSYNQGYVDFKGCYKGNWYDYANAISWFNPTKGPCTGKGSCKLGACKDHVDVFNDNIIPNLRAADRDLKQAKTDYDKLLIDITTEVSNDPDFQNEQLQIQTQAEQEGKTSKTKWWIFGIIAIVLIVGVGIIYFKFIRK